MIVACKTVSIANPAHHAHAIGFVSTCTTVWTLGSPTLRLPPADIIELRITRHRCANGGYNFSPSRRNNENMTRLKQLVSARPNKMNTNQCEQTRCEVTLGRDLKYRWNETSSFRVLRKKITLQVYHANRNDSMHTLMICNMWYGRLTCASEDRHTQYRIGFDIVAYQLAGNAMIVALA